MSNANIAQSGTDNTKQWSSSQRSNPANQLNSYSMEQPVGFDETKRTLKPVFRPGTVFKGEGDVWWVYAQASAAIAAATRSVLTISGSTFTAAGGSGSIKTVSAYLINQYGWFISNAPIITG